MRQMQFDERFLNRKSGNGSRGRSHRQPSRKFEPWDLTYWNIPPLYFPIMQDSFIRSASSVFATIGSISFKLILSTGKGVDERRAADEEGDS